MHKRQKMHDVHRARPMAPDARPPACMMSTRRMHNLYFLGILACTIRTSAMHDMHWARARCARRRNPDDHATHGPAGGRTRIYSGHRDEPGPCARQLGRKPPGDGPLSPHSVGPGGPTVHEKPHQSTGGRQASSRTGLTRRIPTLMMTPRMTFGTRGIEGRQHQKRPPSDVRER